MTRLGFVFVRRAAAPRYEAFYNQIVSGLEDGLAATGSTLMVAGVEDHRQELSIYRHWRRTRAVDGVVVKDLLTEDDRIDQLRSIGMPFVVLGDVTQPGSFSAVRIDNGRAMRDCTAFLVSQGHRHVARVAGPTAFVHTTIRTQIFETEARAAGIKHTVVAGDYTERAGQQETTTLMTGADRPTAIVYDNDLMALGGLTAARTLGIEVPHDLSLLAWDDSVLCQLASPPLSALSHDVHQIGLQLAESALHMLASDTQYSEVASQPTIIERGTTASALLHSPDRSASSVTVGGANA